jgi:hypothetical protein
MENRNILKKFLLPALCIAAITATRLLPHPPNFTPVGAVALFSGALIPGPAGVLIPLIALFLSDTFLGFHDTLLYVYGSFLIIFLIGKYLKKQSSFGILSGSSLLSSVLFFVITNFGVWQATTLYPKTLSGLFQSYVMGLPFFGNTVAGDFVYTMIIFYGYRYIDNILETVYHAHRKHRI